jgi:uncharacterized coiled-coil protein SlyX
MTFELTGTPEDRISFLEARIQLFERRINDMQELHEYNVKKMREEILLMINELEKLRNGEQK